MTKKTTTKARTRKATTKATAQRKAKASTRKAATRKARTRKAKAATGSTRVSQRTIRFETASPKADMVTPTTAERYAAIAAAGKKLGLPTQKATVLALIADWPSDPKCGSAMTDPCHLGWVLRVHGIRPARKAK